jgi:peptidoglycan/LPS O-acetylase OafA/YrhL
LWSLPYEVQMYLTLPVVFLALRASGDNTRLIVIYMVGIFLSLFHPLFQYVPCFLAGVIAYRLLGTVQPPLRAWVWCPAIIGIVMLYVWTPYSDAN